MACFGAVFTPFHAVLRRLARVLAAFGPRLAAFGTQSPPLSPLLGTFLCHFADEARTNRTFLSSKSSKRLPTGGITTVFLNAAGAYILYIHQSAIPLVMKSTPFFLIGLALLSLCGAASAQTTPSAPSKSTKRGAHQVSTPASKRTAFALPYKLDTAALRRSGRPADAIINSLRDIPRSIPSKK